MNRGSVAVKQNPGRLLAYRGFKRDLLGGEGGIRTLGESPHDGFQDRYHQPLGHLSVYESRNAGWPISIQFRRPAFIEYGLADINSVPASRFSNDYYTNSHCFEQVVFSPRARLAYDFL